MILLNIFDIKDMMAHLLLAESFDSYLLEEAAVTTFAKMEMKGRRNMEWYDLEEQRESLPDHLYWKEAKPVIYAYIKGKRTPHSFHSLRASSRLTRKKFFRKTISASHTSEQIPHLFNSSLL